MVRANRFNPPSAPRMYTKEYKQWRGVYFTNDESLLDDSHSPAMQNLVRDTNGDWEKRLGWRTLHALSDRINGIYHLVTSAGVEKRLVHAGSKLYEWTDSATSLVSSGLNNAFSTAFAKNGKLYILDGLNYWVYNGTTLSSVTDSVFIPTTIIGRLPEGGGTAFEAVNLLGAGRKNSFIADGVAAFQLSATNLDTALVTATVGGVAKTEVTDFTVDRVAGKVRFLAIPPVPAIIGTKNVILTSTKTARFVGNGSTTTFQLATANLDTTAITAAVNGTAKAETTDFTVNRVTGLVTFTAAPAAPATAGTENVTITFKKTDSFAGAGTKAYQLDSTALDATAVTATVNGVQKTETTDFTVDRANGIVTFNSTPTAPAVPGTDNVVITFYKTVAGYADRIKKCTIWTFYGIGNNTRVFVSGNPGYKNQDWYSGLDDPTYFPDNLYTKIGADSSSIMGYHKLGSSLLILKEDNEQDATVFERTVELTDNGLVFSLQQGVTGVGAYAKRSFSNLRDDPLFVSRQGIEAIGTYYMETRKTIQNRSLFVNAQLTKEPNLHNAVSVIWKGYYLLCVNSHCYVADSTMKTGKNTSNNETYNYEFAYWTNIPAVSFFELNEELYFGTADGKLCKFNTDRLYTDGKIAMSAYSDDGEAIDASLATILDDDGDFMCYKTIPINGSGVLVKPFTYSSVAVSAVDESSNALTVGSTQTGIFDFADINFDNFTFNTSSSPQTFPFATLILNYQRLRYIIRNNVAEEGFGLAGIIKRYYYGGYVR